MADQFIINTRVLGNPVRQINKSIDFLGDKPKAISLSDRKLAGIPSRCKKVIESWHKQFYFVEEKRENDIVIEKGLRPPQIGAIHATLAHWKVTNTSATIVMPTGTGKTEAMLALAVCEEIDKILVVVPTDALREQITNKFLGLGLLREIRAIGKKAQNPVVGTLEHRPKTVEEVNKFFGFCNVVVTTMAIVGGCSEEVQRSISEISNYLFIDEAHHISAPTWQKFRRFFKQKTILQFTATPFRGDGKHIDGKVIFNYPLRKAQSEGYFKPISFIGVRDYNKQQADETIAKRAIKKLDEDMSQNLDHIVLARADSISRAKEIFDIYQRLGSKYKPQLFHSKKKIAEKHQSLKEVNERRSRIIVCVDMFGEGFDLPELKIAALHDIHKGLAITLQFTGRFTRTKPNIGSATVVANIANPGVEEALKDLYAEDADWNSLLRNLSEGATVKQEKLSQFFEGFVDLPPEFLPQNILPKMSTVVYKTNNTRWKPEDISKVVKESRLFIDPTVNQQEKVVFFVTCEKEPIPWGNFKDIRNTIWDLYLIYWDESQKLLFINSSNNQSFHEELAKAICGNDVEIIRGEQVFRTLSGINRLSLMNLGLTHSLNRAMRFTMYVGADILSAISDAQQQNRIKSNLFGRGFENGEKTSIGSSYKGRIWSYKIADDISEWIEWCKQIGKKLLDDTFSATEILKYVLHPTSITQRPDLVPLTIEWPEDLLLKSEESVELNIAGKTIPLYEADIELSNFNKTGPIKFRIFCEGKSVEYKMVFNRNNVEYLPIGRNIAQILISRKSILLSDWLKDNSPTIRFENDSYLQYNILFENPADRPAPFDKGKIEVWDWGGTDLSKESQTQNKETDTIQYRVIQDALKPEHRPQYDILFDDDDSYESADVVGIKMTDEKLTVDFFHCKFSNGATPGSRIEDLYAVCGQAQKSVHWRDNPQNLVDHLILREVARQNKGQVSRFEKGDIEKLEEIRNKIPYLTPEFTITIVQPGLSKNQASNDQLGLLAVTENYLKETHAIKLGIIASR